MLKCAHMNVGDLGSILAVCACAYDPIHVTAQGKSIGKNCACVLPPCMYVPSSFSSPEPVVSWSRGRETRGSGGSRYRMSENF